MDNRDAVSWAFRLLLNREPTEDERLHFDPLAADLPTLRRQLRHSAEFHSLLDRAGQIHRLEDDVDWEEAAHLGYLIVLGRQPDREEIAYAVSQTSSLNSLRLLLTTRREFEVQWPEDRLLAEFAVVNAFAPFPSRSSMEGAFQDILGSVTKVAYLASAWQHLAGHVYSSVPRDSEHRFHGVAEWVGTLRSVLEARDALTVIELGAGWAPWLIIAAKAAQARGIRDVDLTGIEGAAGHFEFMIDNFRSNGLDPNAHALHRAVVGREDGIALFPRLNLGKEDYGANAVFSPDEWDAAARRGDLEEVPSIALRTLLAPKARVDLVHLDIQGHEEVVIRSAIEQLNEKARRLVIGTHSRTIEGHLFDLLHEHGWVCESETPCLHRPTVEGGMELCRDGEQIWRNERVPSHLFSV